MLFWLYSWHLVHTLIWSLVPFVFVVCRCRSPFVFVVCWGRVPLMPFDFVIHSLVMLMIAWRWCISSTKKLMILLVSHVLIFVIFLILVCKVTGTRIWIAHVIDKFLFVLVSWLIQFMLHVFLKIVVFSHRNPPSQVHEGLIFSLKTKWEGNQKY